ncbi:MAG: hypothetical protein BWY69_00433 [Planctomycetes bacterium ADurb.Bin401]|nr:MAG: hypothetical protein BWY69_00433 [Planctomycetes bacterium ADurb.Bin401]
MGLDGREGASRLGKKDGREASALVREQEKAIGLVDAEREAHGATKFEEPGESELARGLVASGIRDLLREPAKRDGPVRVWKAVTSVDPMCGIDDFHVVRLA